MKEDSSFEESSKISSDEVSMIWFVNILWDSDYCMSFKMISEIRLYFNTQFEICSEIIW
jgi:hypothetical protein